MRLVNDLLPHNQWALLAGSVTTAQRTAGSDLDLLDQHGGPLFDGYRVAGERPSRAPHERG